MSDLERIAVDLEAIIASARAAQERLGLLPEPEPERERKPKADPLAWSSVCPVEFQWATLAPEGRVLMGARLKSKESGEAMRELAGLVDQAPVGVTLLGAAGRGKSTLAAAYFHSHYLRGDRFAYAGAAAKLRQGWPLGEGEPPPLERLMKCRLLWLDDLGAESSDRDGCLADIIQARHLHQRPTIFTTGLTYGGLVSRYGAGIARRVFERQVLLDLGGVA